MLKRVWAVFFIIIVAFSTITVFAESSNTYKDSTTGISFTIPHGWSQVPLTEEREYIKVKYLPESNDGASIQFGCADIWDKMSDSDKVGCSRSDINHSSTIDSYTKEEILQMLGYDSLGAKIDTVYYDGIEYLKIAADTEMSVFNVSANVRMIILLRIDNGYWYQFVYGDMDGKSHFQEFEAMMNSVEYPTSTKTSYKNIDTNNYGNQQLDFSNLFLSVLITITIYSLPIIIYRYGIKKRALSEKKAKKITFIYGTIAFFVMAILLGGAPGGAIILWSFVNYKVLTTPNKNDNGTKHEVSDDGINLETHLKEVNKENIEIAENEVEEDEVFVGGFVVEEIEETGLEKESTIETKLNKEHPVIVEEIIEIKNHPKVLFCRKCGTRLLDDSDFCHKCGLRVIKEDVR